nr:hypothetical protein Q903MT_gene2287 [Picea sitchensis]
MNDDTLMQSRMVILKPLTHKPTSSLGKASTNPTLLGRKDTERDDGGEAARSTE